MLKQNRMSRTVRVFTLLPCFCSNRGLCVQCRDLVLFQLIHTVYAEPMNPPVLVCSSGADGWSPEGGRMLPPLDPGGGGKRPPAMGRDLAAPPSFFLMF